MPPRLGEAQAAVYAAEREALDGRGRSWRGTREVQAYLDHLVTSEWFSERWPHFVHCAVERRGAGSVYSTNEGLDDAGPDGRPTEGVVLLAGRPLRQEVVLHELAHLLAPPGCGHTAPFVDVQLELVRGEMGFFAWAEYRAALEGRRRARVVP